MMDEEGEASSAVNNGGGWCEKAERIGDDTEDVRLEKESSRVLRDGMRCLRVEEKGAADMMTGQVDKRRRRRRKRRRRNEMKYIYYLVNSTDDTCEIRSVGCSSAIP